MNKIIRFIKQNPFVFIGVVVLVLILWSTYLRVFQHRDWATWTGFGAFTNPNGEFQPAKTLWDFLELLIIPIALAITAYLFTKSENNRQRDFELERTREIAFQEYLTQIENLVKSGLLEKENDKLRAIARSRTLSLLKTLDGKRKGLVIQYLNEFRLIHNAWDENIETIEDGITYYRKINHPSIINLMGADLSNIQFIDPVNDNYPNTIEEFWKTGFNLDLSNINFSRTNLTNANFYSARLDKVNFYSCNLHRADFSFSVGSEINFRQANLQSTKFNFVQYWSTDFSNADFSEAQINHTQFNGVKFFSNGSELNKRLGDFAKFNNTSILETSFFACDITPEQIKNAGMVTNIRLPSNAIFRRDEVLFSWHQTEDKFDQLPYEQTYLTSVNCKICNEQLEGVKFRDYWDSFELHSQESHGKPKKGL
jgi:uncharacterized protein YjbI with pentapeptide repeats